MEMQVINSIRKGKIAKAFLADRKSRFIALVGKADSPEEARAFYESVSADNPDARHVVYAWRVLDEGDTVLERSSDDGEPSQTAGLPVLEVLRGAEMVNVCACVVRYFGGVLLGPGGLKRAYEGCAKEALRNAEEEGLLCAISKQFQFKTTLSYKQMKTFEHLLKAHDGAPLGLRYEEEIEVRFFVPTSQRKPFQQALSDTFHGEISLEATGTSYEEVHVDA